MQQFRDLATASHTDGQNLNELANATVVDDVKVLSQFPELVAFRKGSGGRDGRRRSKEASVVFDEERSPVERMADARADHEAELALTLMNRIRASDPTRQERSSDGDL
jgi:restriction endonuclease Mrr